MSSTPVASPEDNHQVYDVAESEQWSREPMPVENGTPQEWSDAPPPLGIPGPSSNGINPGYYNNGLSFNGNGIIPIPGNSVNIPFERNVNGMYTMNGVRPPHNVITPGMCRPNGFAPNALNGNGYVNAVANGRFIRAPGWVTTNKVSNGVKKQKRNRTAFTSQQMMELEQEYARTRYLDRNRRIELSETLNLNQRTIKIWFQNRRMKEKKDRAESLEECESEEVSTTESSPDLTSDIPTFIDQYPVMVTSNDMLNRGGLYMEHYPVSTIPSAIMTPALPRTIASAMPSSLTSPLPSSVPSTLPAALPPVQNQIPNDFMEYVPEVYDPQCKQVHLQMQHYNTPFDGTLQEVPHESVSSEASPPSAPTSMTNQSWDLSWIRSIHAEEDIF